MPYKLQDGTITRDRVTPIFDDSIFIDCHRRFIEALAKRYDGDSRLSGIDVGSFGNWGEWHCWELWPKGTGAKEMQKVSAEVRRRYADMYLRNFRKTPHDDPRRLRVQLRLRHQQGVLSDFKWAVKEVSGDGALELGTMPEGTGA